jgi:hypothetical protein
MLRAWLIAVTLVVLPLGLAAEAPAERGANAALAYWRAFATLPRLTEAAQKKLNAECLTMPLDAHARDVVQQAAYSLRLLHHGAARSRCDWGIAWEDEGIEVRLPHNDAARLLCSLACLRARVRFENGQSAAALDDVVAGMTLARHVGHDGVFVMTLTGYAIEHRMSEAVAQYLPRLDAATIKDLKKRLDALPPPPRTAAALQLEEKWALSWFARKVKQANDKDSLLAFLSQGADTPEKGRALLQACGGTAEGVLEWTEKARPSYARMARQMELPLDPFARAWDREASQQAGNPVFALLFPAVEKVRWAQARAEVRRALLAAALAVAAEGRDALKDHLDPVAGGRFEYAAFAGGFELRSRLQADETLRAKWKLDERTLTPLTYTAGRRGP